MDLGYDFIGGNTLNSHILSDFIELVHPNDNMKRVHTALEYTFSKFFHLRGGYKFN